ncbi:MAG: hypothetical protein DMF65_00985, partial [Acidobacteria bacterium]
KTYGGGFSDAFVSKLDTTSIEAQFDSATYNVNEGDKKVVVQVDRSGDLTGPATFEYATSDGTASSRSDYTATAGTLFFAHDETTKFITIYVTDDMIGPEGVETFNVTLSNPSGGGVVGATATTTVRITDNDTQTSSSPVAPPNFAADFFVRQHYLDFLGREPDAAGAQFWQNEIASCGADAQCRDVKRINVSAAFFLSIEFQETGYFVERMYKAAYGDATSPSVAGTVPVIRLQEFLHDVQEVRDGVVVGQGNWRQQLDTNKVALALEFVQRQRFLNAFPFSLTNEQFVDRLNQNTGGALSQDEVNHLVAELNAGTFAGRAQVLREVADDADLQRNEFNRAFVLMEYYGYLRRNPDDAPDSDFRGWKFWLDKLNQSGGDFVKAEMVKAFINSDEYKHRFGS